MFFRAKHSMAQYIGHKEDGRKLLLDIGRMVNGSIVLGILLHGDLPDDTL
jgi:hypothetical protein